MRQLNTFEINEVSGAGFFSSIGAAALGTVMGLGTGVIKGGIAGGNTGGVLGAGIIAAGVGVIVGGIAYSLQGALYGLVNDWDKTLELFNTNTEYFLDYSNNLPK
ncbi:hypothetical protein AAGQ96_01885 [Pantoea sp. MBD-2R]|uniref:hypothetical protein n=1 Tax=unclassified Pantoea TaxID=2630326 RepID=UPI0011BFDEDF|nr:hypothetical protein [Pantoea sp. CCBC3-3-1]